MRSATSGFLIRNFDFINYTQLLPPVSSEQETSSDDKIRYVTQCYLT